MVINAYKYLGICLSTRFSVSHALKDMAARAKIGVVNILKLRWSLWEKAPSIFFTLFAVQIQPIKILGLKSGVWRFGGRLERNHPFCIREIF